MNSQQEFLKQVKEKEHPLIVLPDHLTKDLICAGIGLFNELKKENKDVSLVSLNKPEEDLNFLSGFSEIQRKIEHSRDFILSFDTSKNPIKNVHYEKEENRLNIFITPEKETINPKDFSFSPGQFKFDLLIVLGAPDLQSIGRLWEENADLFFELPIINIDCHINNEQFGQINLLNVKASGVSEILSQIFLENNIPLEATASFAFYAGVLTSTDSFQSPKTTPKTLTTAAQLIDHGANHQEVVRFLYKNQDIQTIKLWGRFMSQLQYNSKINLAWSIIQFKDFGGSNFDLNKIKKIFDRIRFSFSRTEVLMLIWENEKGFTEGLIQNSNQEFLQNLLNGSTWGSAVFFERKKPLLKAEKEILEILEKNFKTEE